MKKIMWKSNTKFKMLTPDCFMPDQVINMSEGNHKRIEMYNYHLPFLI